MDLKKGSCLVLALFLCSLIPFSEGLDEFQPNPLPFFSYDNFALDLQWPPSICSNLTVYCSLSYEKRFIIHSFQPRSYFRPFGCSGPPFDMAKIEHIKPQLTKVWYNMVNGSSANEIIWKKAWENNGICSSSDFNEADYFELALNIKNNLKYSVLDIVQSVGITPKESNPLWKRSRFYNAIYWRLGKKPVLLCNTNKYTKKPQLAEVRLCFAKDGIELIDCPEGGNCPKYFTWPTYANPPPPPPPPPANSLSINNQ